MNEPLMGVRKVVNFPRSLEHHSKHGCIDMKHY
jgi:hypothetical protein